MTPNEPIDEYHRISLALTQRIREWYNAMQAEVAKWTLGTYNKEKHHEPNPRNVDERPGPRRSNLR